MEAQPSSQMSVFTRAARRNIPEGGILHIRLYSLQYFQFPSAAHRSEVLFAAQKLVTRTQLYALACLYTK
jgi:hypothetical protein